MLPQVEYMLQDRSLRKYKGNMKNELIIKHDELLEFVKKNGVIILILLLNCVLFLIKYNFTKNLDLILIKQKD